MAAFKSSSRKGSYTPSSIASTPAGDRPRRKDVPEKKVPLRRSKSVTDPSTAPSSNLPEYLNTIENPLYGCSSSSSASSEFEKSVGADKDDAFRGRRRRTASRISDLGSQSSDFRKEPGQSMSRVDTWRGKLRSASQGHYGPEIEVDYGNELSEKAKNLKTWASKHPISDTCEASSVRQCDDAVSTYSFSEVEEATIREFLESDNQSVDVGGDTLYETVRSEIKHDLEMGKSPEVIAAEDIIEISSELVNPELLDIVSNVRREYAAKLKQSQEQARKLQVDLAVEEQRAKELSRILKEMLPDPMTSTKARKTCPRRRVSIERLKMSRRLEEEALSYFGESVSISTFDGSDFSSQEDQPALGIPNGNSRSLCNASSKSSASVSTMDLLHHYEETDHHMKCSFSINESDLASSSSSNKSADMIHESTDYQSKSGTPQAAFEPAKSVGLHQFGDYIKIFQRNNGKDVEYVKTRSGYNPDGYASNMSAETLLFDKVLFKSRIQLGNMLICDIRQL